MVHPSMKLKPASLGSVSNDPMIGTPAVVNEDGEMKLFSGTIRLLVMITCSVLLYNPQLSGRLIKIPENNIASEQKQISDL